MGEDSVEHVTPAFVPWRPGGVPRRRRARHCQLAIILAGTLVATTFFMPALSCIESPDRINPYQQIRHFVKDDVRHAGLPAEPWLLEEWISRFVVYIAPYLFAGLVAVAAAARLAEHTGAQRGVAWLMAALVAACAAGVLYCAAREYVLWDGYIAFSLDSRHFVRCALLPAVVLGYACGSMRRAGRASIGLSFMGSLLCLFWWGYWMTRDVWLPAQYGLWLAFAGTVLLLPPLVYEQACLTRRWPLHALGQILIARPEHFTRSDGCCPACGYLLRGSAAPRCPECGRPFHPDEIGDRLDCWNEREPCSGMPVLEHASR